MKVVMIKREMKVGVEIVPLILLIKQEITILISDFIIIVFKTITTNYNSITHQYCFSCSSNNQTTTYANTQLLIIVTSFVNTNDDITNTVSKTLQVIISQVTLLSLHIRSIAATANDIADIANINLTNFIALFYFKLLLSFV